MVTTNMATTDELTARPERGGLVVGWRRSTSLPRTFHPPHFPPVGGHSGVGLVLWGVHGGALEGIHGGLGQAGGNLPV